MAWWLEQCQLSDQIAYQAALDHQLQLTKPTGSLGDLEQVATQLASLQSTSAPQIDFP